MRETGYDYRRDGAYGACQRCDFQCRVNDLRQEWSGFRVCPECFDPPPDTLRPPSIYPEGLPRPNASPELPPVFVTAGPIDPRNL